MKKGIILSLITTLCLMNVLLIFFVDNKKSEIIHNFGKKNSELFFVPLNIEISQDQSANVLNIAKSNNVTLAKYKEKKENKETDYYIQYEDTALTIDSLSAIKQQPLQKDQQLLMTTKFDEEASYYLKDFLKNEHIRYYNWSKFIDKKIEPGEFYILAYDELQNFDQFILDLANELKIPAQSFFDFTNNEELMNKNERYYITLAVLIVFFFIIFQIYHLKKHNDQIGIMKLLGFSNRKITCKLGTILFKTSSLYIIITSFLNLLVIPNVTANYLICSIAFTIFFSVTTLLLFFLIISMNSNEQVALLIKGKKLSKPELYITYIVKVILVVSFLLLFQFTLKSYKELKVISADLNYLSEQANYLFIEGFYDNPLPIADMKFEEQVTIWFDHLSQQTVDLFYADFQMDFISGEASKSFGIVDQNYLIREKFEILDHTGKVVSYGDIIQGDYLLFPLNMKKVNQKEFINEFLDFAGYSIDDAQNQIYFYQKKELTTYSLEIPPSLKDYLGDYRDNSKKVEPIPLIVIKKFPTQAMINYKSGALKLIFNKKSKKTDFYNKVIEPSLKDHELESILKVDSFKSITELVKDLQVTNQQKIRQSQWVIAVILVTYIIVLIPQLQLFITLNQNELIVKAFLGYSKLKIFKEILQVNGLLAFSSVILSFVIGEFLFSIVSILNATVCLLAIIAMDLGIVWLLTIQLFTKKMRYFMKGRSL